MLLKPKPLICPRCEKPFEGHEENACQRKLSRRHFFFGILAAPLIPALIAPMAVPAAASGSLKMRYDGKLVTVGQIKEISVGNLTFKLKPPFRVAAGEIITVRVISKPAAANVSVYWEEP